MTESMTVYDFNALLKEAAAGNAWPIGDYDFEITEATATRAATSGNPMIKVKFRCLVGPYAGKFVTNNFNLTPDNGVALSIFFRQMASLGLDNAFFSALGTTGDLTPVANALIGRRCRITIGHREWGGVTQNDVKAIKTLTEGMAPSSIPGGQVPMSPPQLSVVPPPPSAQQPTAPPQYAPPAAAPVAPPAATPPPTPQAPPQYTPPPPPQMPPAAPPAPAAIYAPPAPPTTQLPVSPPASQAAPQPPASNGWLPPGFTQELWNAMPEASKNAIIAAQAPPPAPPGLPV